MPRDEQLEELDRELNEAATRRAAEAARRVSRWRRRKLMAVGVPFRSARDLAERRDVDVDELVGKIRRAQEKGMPLADALDLLLPIEL